MTRSTKSSALRCRGGYSGISGGYSGISGGNQSAAQRWDVLSPGWKQLHPLISGMRGEDEPGHQCWTLGKGRWQPPYLLIYVDAAGPEGGGPVACHVIVSRRLGWGLLQLPGHCGEGGTPSAPQLNEALSLPRFPLEQSCGTNAGPLGSPLGRSSSAPKRCPHVPQVLTSSFVLWRKKP